MTDRERKLQTETTAGGRKPWTTPDLIQSEITSSTEKLSSTVELYVPTFDRHLGPS